MFDIYKQQLLPQNYYKQVRNYYNVPPHFTNNPVRTPKMHDNAAVIYHNS